MSPESFNAALALRKLEAVDILLKQAKTGSDADRIRAASAILRVPFFSPSLREGAGGRVRGVTNNPAAPDPSAPQAESLQASGGSRGHSDESGGARGAAPGTPPNPSPTPQGSYSAANSPSPREGAGGRVSFVPMSPGPTHTPVHTLATLSSA